MTSRFGDDLVQRARQAVAAATASAPPADVSPMAPALATTLDATELALQATAALCRRFEGFYSVPYLCPAGVPTIGYGATYYADGRPVRMTDPAITRDQAERLLLLQVRRVYLPAVLRLCPGVNTPYRLAALIDFSFNLGAGNLQASTLRRRVNAGRWADVPGELAKWNKSGGRELRGLTLRRRAEAQLIPLES